MESNSMYVYLTSLGSSSYYPNNTVSTFTNKIHPINLEFKRKYEVSLANILIPPNIYSVLKNDVRYTMKIHYEDEINAGWIESNVLYFEENVLKDDTYGIVKEMNNMLYKCLNKTLSSSDQRPFEMDDIFSRVESKNSTKVLYKIINNRETELYLRNYHAAGLGKIYFEFSPKLASILGFIPGETYEFLRSGKKSLDSSTLSVTPKRSHLMRTDGGIDYFVVYTNIITPTRFDNSLVNVLEVFSVDDHRTRDKYEQVYKPLDTNVIDEISIKICDQNGDPINFMDGQSLACILHIREKI